MGGVIVLEKWLDMAIRDLKSAKVLFEHDCGNDYVAFHCQQAIEKALKALIIYLYATLEQGHSLLYLCKKVMAQREEFSQYLKDCAFVNQYYIETRYPNENAIIVSNEEAENCLNIAENILNAVKEVIKI